MNISHSFQISSSALTAQRLRMDVISSNIANVNTTRAQFKNGTFVPYRRKLTVMEPFQQIYNQKIQAGNGVRATQIVEDPAPFKPVYDPTHPDADVQGYVQMPNIDVAKEMVDMISATRAYEASVTALNASKSMITKALEIGR